ncbi:MAG: GT4 family glycosyltransferase PelF [Verrucomicrobiales bacterium]|nr:GT4 family glycosyltransferase PelF [Verrucomicrobiales bacterium]
MKKIRREADVCLVLEGTYPYVSGGVSTWVHQILHAYPDLQFALFYLGANRRDAGKLKYDLPANVISLTEAWLFDQPAPGRWWRPGIGPRWTPFFEDLRRLLVHAPTGTPHEFYLIAQILTHISQHPGPSYEALWQDRETWDLIRELYERYAAEESFLDFYWTCRFLAQPLWNLARAMAQMPKARLYHTACTGYAGLAAALAAQRTGRPLLLTEHGIYLRERINDICQSRWIKDPPQAIASLDDPLSSLRRLWIGFFRLVGCLCYGRSEVIVSLFERNAEAQRHFGAEADRIQIIPNGIRVEEFNQVWQQRRERRETQPESAVVGFLGRVVSIKDVKTLLRVAARVRDSVPAVRFIIAGPTDEEPGYFEECEGLVRQLQLADTVEFTGPKQRNDFLPEIDLMILTSVSEGLPFVILEAMAAGVPVVSTDVGACAELIHGAADEAPACGLAGRVAGVGRPADLAAACIELLQDAALLDELGENGRCRVREHFHEDRVLSAYRVLYQELSEKPEAEIVKPRTEREVRV